MPDIRRLIAIAWYSLGFLIILLASLVSLLQLALPYVGRYQEAIEQAMNRSLGQPVFFSEVSAEWRQWHVQFLLKDARFGVANRQGKGVDAGLVSIHIHPLKSLMRARLVVDAIAIHRLDLHLGSQTDGSPRLEDGLPGMLLGISDLPEMPDILIDDLDIHWQEQLQLRDGQLRLYSDDQTLHVSLRSAPPTDYGEDMLLEMRVDKAMPFHSGSGRLHLQLAQPQWLKLFSLPALAGIHLPEVAVQRNAAAPNAWPELSQDKGRLRLWLVWEDGGISTARASLSATGLRVLSAEGHGLDIGHLELSAELQRQHGDDWQLLLKNNALTLNGRRWPAAQHRLRLWTRAGTLERVSAEFGHLHLETVLGALRFSRVGPEWLVKSLAEYDVGGDMQELELTLQKEIDDSLQISRHRGRFAGLTVRRQGTEEGMSLRGMEGVFSGDGERTQLLLEGDVAQLHMPRIFPRPLPTGQFQARMDVLRDEVGTRLSVGRLQLEKAPLSFDLSGEFQFPAGEIRPMMDFRFSVQQMALSSFYQYLPRVIGQRLRDWFRDAFIDGSIEHASVILQGDPAEFPYRDGDGTFEVSADISNAHIKYHPHWPALEAVDMELQIHNAELTAHTNHATVFETDIRNSAWRIADLGADSVRLGVSGRLSGHSDDARQFILDSPLRRRAGLERLARLNLSGDLDLDLDLDIRISRSGHPHKVAGRVHLSDTIVESETGLGLQGLEGTVVFDAQGMRSEEMRAIYNTLPVELSLHKGLSQPLHMQLSGRFSKEFLLGQLLAFHPDLRTVMPMLKHVIEGESDWVLGVQEDEKGAKRLHLHSDLQGLQLRFPPPFDKDAATVRSFDLHASLQEMRLEQMSLHYDTHRADFFFGNQQEEPQLDALSVGLGGGSVPQRRDNTLHVRGGLMALDVSAWHSILPRRTGPGRWRLTPDVDVHIDHVRMLGATLRDVGVSVDGDPSGMEIRLAGEEVEGVIKIPQQLDGVWQIDLQRLFLSALSDTGEAGRSAETSVAPARQPLSGNMPALQVDIASMRYANWDFGKTQIQLDTGDDGLRIEQFRAARNGVLVDGSGGCSSHGEQPSCMFNVTASSERLHGLQQALGYPEKKFIGAETELKMELSWPGSITDFSLREMEGSIHVDIGKGQMLDVESATGRFIGLLNLQTLQRRLSLDFSDLFGKGFSFDRISGDFVLEDGNAYTQNLVLTAPSSQVAMIGRVGIIDEDYDQVMWVTPSLSENVPLLSALLGPVGVGAGVVFYLDRFLFEKTFSKKINSFLQAKYQVTGSWEDPQVSRIQSSQEVEN